MRHLLLATILFAPSAFACEPHLLRLTTPEGAEDTTPVTVQFTLRGTTLHTRFEVKTPSIAAPEKIPAGSYPYQFDVVELFLSANGALPYFELELSPYDETYFVKINDPQKPFLGGITLPVDHKVTRDQSGWVGELDIPLESLGWRGDKAKLIGNAFAIQGVKPSRRYYSRSLPPQKKASFHQPAFFKPLLDCPLAQ